MTISTAVIAKAMIDFDKLHTTPLGEKRIRRNLGITYGNIIDICRKIISDNNALIIRKGKNWYVKNQNVTITINITKNTIITAHKNE